MRSLPLGAYPRSAAAFRHRAVSGITRARITGVGRAE
jgi:hypothetical protein